MTGVSIEWFEARIPCGPISKWFQAVPNPQDDNAFIEALAAHDALWRKSIEHHASDVESEMPDMNLGLWRAVLAVYAPDGKVGVTCKGVRQARAGVEPARPVGARVDKARRRHRAQRGHDRPARLARGQEAAALRLTGPGIGDITRSTCDTCRMSARSNAVVHVVRLAHRRNDTNCTLCEDCLLAIHAVVAMSGEAGEPDTCPLEGNRK